MKTVFNKFIKSAVVAIIIGSAASVPVLAAPILYVDDFAGNLGTVDVASGAVKVIGSTGQSLVDIAFDPTGNLYGITFNQLFRISKTTGAATLVGNLGTSLNSLVFGSDGTLYGASDRLYTINKTSGAATSISNGSGGYSFTSAGDLAFIGSDLFLTSISTPGDNLVNLNTTNGKGKLVGAIGFSNVFGLASDNGLNLYGLSGTQILGINSATGVGTLLGNYAGHGLLGANGSAFFTEAGAPSPVPEPATALLMGLGSLGLFLTRRKYAKK